jgi:hypothetical protein
LLFAPEDTKADPVHISFVERGNFKSGGQECALHERAFEFLARARALEANSRFLAAKAARNDKRLWRWKLPAYAKN